MNQTPTPKSKQEILAEFKEMIDSSYHTKKTDIEHDIAWLSSVLDAYLLWAIGQAEPKNKEEVGEYTQQVAEGWNTAIDEYTTRLKKLIEE